MTVSATVRNAPPRFRSSTIRGGSSGARTRASTTANRASRTAPVARAPVTSAELHPFDAASLNPYTSATKPPVTSRTPGASMRGCACARTLRSTKTPPRKATIATGTLTSMHQRHCTYSVRAPQSRRPTAPPLPAIAPKTANALARSRGSVKVIASRESTVGARSAAKAPCVARAATRTPKFGGSPTRRRGNGEPSQAHEERPPAPQPVGESAAEQQEPAEGERVGGDRPLAPWVGDMQGALSGRQGDVDDRGVKRDHQLGEGDEHQGEPAAGTRSCRGVRRPRTDGGGRGRGRWGGRDGGTLRGGRASRRSRRGAAHRAAPSSWMPDFGFIDPVMVLLRSKP